MKHLDLNHRILFAHLILALARENENPLGDPTASNDEIVEAMLRMGYLTNRGDRKVLCQNARLFFDRDTPDVTEGMMVPFFMEVYFVVFYIKNYFCQF